MKAKEIDTVRQWLREAEYPLHLIFYQAKYRGSIAKYLTTAMKVERCRTQSLLYFAHPTRIFLYNLYSTNEPGRFLVTCLPFFYCINPKKVEERIWKHFNQTMLLKVHLRQVYTLKLGVACWALHLHFGGGTKAYDMHHSIHALYIKEDSTNTKSSW